jgi:hypothetical protein
MEKRIKQMMAGEGETMQPQQSQVSTLDELAKLAALHDQGSPKKSFKSIKRSSSELKLRINLDLTRRQVVVCNFLVVETARSRKLLAFKCPEFLLGIVPFSVRSP